MLLDTIVLSFFMQLIVFIITSCTGGLIIIAVFKWIYSFGLQLLRKIY